MLSKLNRQPSRLPFVVQSLKNNNNKLLQHLNSKSILVMGSSQVVQTRNLQLKTPLHIGFFDDVAGTYKTLHNPFHLRFKLSMKPWEFRTGYFFWYLNFGGILILSAVLAVSMFFVFYYGFYFLYANVGINGLRRFYNPHPFLEVRNGKDLAETYDPLGKLYVYLSPFRGEDKTLVFYRELEAAAKRRL
ncbi:hypothetical protein C9374_002973 [Naegleria lovaniensis]|uniref:Transmembrane protein n=1 Tax=Naegleria lovaniensis TaxID=51637 RepID=A0AA88KLG8_NAELO|nr:uncharacterized protein C9374_002973 [Naegleria lovaniensis]KAG2385824.1 hypothetical protein C9374_002973 [Naegleria lovaniensis]